MYPDQIGDVPRRKWRATPVAGVMIPMEKVEAVALDESRPGVLDRMEEAHARLVAVVSGDKVVGVIGREHLLERSRRAEMSGRFIRLEVAGRDPREPKSSQSHFSEKNGSFLAHRDRSGHIRPLRPFSRPATSQKRIIV